MFLGLMAWSFGFICYKLSNLKFWKPSVTPLKLKQYSHAHCLIHKFIVSYLRIEHSFIAKFFKFHPCRIIFSKIIIIWMYSNGIRIPLKIKKKLSGNIYLAESSVDDSFFLNRIKHQIIELQTYCLIPI